MEDAIAKFIFGMMACLIFYGLHWLFSKKEKEE